jgi:hypothetical protein
MPETGFTMLQHSLTVYEAGNSVPYTGKLTNLAKQDVVSIIDKTLKDDARKYFDIEAFLQFKTTPLRFAPDLGQLGHRDHAGHQRHLLDHQQPRVGHRAHQGRRRHHEDAQHPPYIMDDYVSIAEVRPPSAAQELAGDLHQYTETGLAHIFNGEIGRYESFRFIEQTFIPKGGAADSTTYDPWSAPPTPGTTACPPGRSSWAPTP